MNATCFCWWLQGCFDAGELSVLGPAHVQAVVARLGQVKMDDPEHEDLFVDWLEASLRGVLVLDPATTSKVRRLLARRLLQSGQGGENRAPHHTVAPMNPQGSAPSLPSASDPNTPSGKSEHGAHPRYTPKAVVFDGSGPVMVSTNEEG